MIEIRDCTKRFGRVVALRDVTASIPQGQSVALWGGNGAGKTTLIRCILGVFRFSGHVSIAGIDVRRHGRRARALVGYVPQELSFHDDTTLADAMRFYAALRAVPDTRPAELLERFALADHRRKRVRDLSGGMKQRLALCVALLADPPIIVLDEPTSNLDAQARHDVVEALASLKREGRTMVLASHRADEVRALADRVLVLQAGACTHDTTPHHLWPDSLRTLRLHVDGSPRGALGILADAGFSASLNGRGLCVDVPARAKADPILTLSTHGVRVRDFELLDGDHP